MICPFDAIRTVCHRKVKRALHMPKQNYYQKMFFVGAVWNWVATLTFAFGYKILFPLFGMPLPVYPVFFLMF